jgi:hypothetical protein
MLTRVSEEPQTMVLACPETSPRARRRGPAGTPGSALAAIACASACVGWPAAAAAQELVSVPLPETAAQEAPARPGERAGGLRPPSGAPRLVAIQCNPYIGGKYEDRDLLETLARRYILGPLFGQEKNRNGPTTWETAQQFARWVATDCKEGDVIGMQEVVMPNTPDQMLGFIRSATKKPWEVAFERQGRSDRDSGLAVFWRSDRVELVERLGTVDIARLDSGYVVKFMGVVLRHVASGRSFAVFTGKLTWGGAIIGGRAVTDADRVQQARILERWIDGRLAGRPDVSRILAMDMNSLHGGPVWREFASAYRHDGSSEPTHSSRNRAFGFSFMNHRLDYLWFGGPGGFEHAARRSEHFGSDHRAVWATFRLAGAVSAGAAPGTAGP